MFFLKSLRKQRSACPRRWHLIFFISLVHACALSPLAEGHVGSAGVVVQQQAGPYRVLVQVEPPDVVPGTARVTVFVEQGQPQRVSARPIYFRSGDEGAPTPDILTAQADGRYEGTIWLMDSGSSSVEVQLNGPQGNAVVVVPVAAVATALRTMPAGTGASLLALGVLLVVLMVTIVGASLADATLPPGQSISERLRRKRWLGMGIGVVVLGLMLTGWRSWWSAEVDNYKKYNLYQRPALHSNVVASPDGGQTLALRIDTTGFSQNTPKRRLFSFLLPDHGKLMHTFLVRADGLDAFAHLHPARQDSVHFNATLPPLPAGRYWVFSDVVQRSGFSETLVDTLDVTAPKNTLYQPADRDDSYALTVPVGKLKPRTTLRLDADMAQCGKPGDSHPLADGSTMIWTDQPAGALEAGKLHRLKFAVADGAGKATPLEPYLGMAGHAVVVRQEGGVYIHLHPVGTYSMAAEASLNQRIADTARRFVYPDARRFRDSIDRYVAALNALPDAQRNARLMAATPDMSHPMPTKNMVEFPYAFPQPGQYRIWVQVKRQGKVLTGVFDTEVK